MYEKYNGSRRYVKNLIKISKKRAWQEFGKKLSQTYNENPKLCQEMLIQIRNLKINMPTRRYIKDKTRNMHTEEDGNVKKYFLDLSDEGDENREINGENENQQEEVKDISVELEGEEEK